VYPIGGRWGEPGMEQKGLELLKKLIDTLPDSLPHGSRRDKAWLQRAVKTASKYQRR